MPRVKIDYVVSFSSEDSDNPASNLLGWDVSKKRWLCAKGEPSCSVVLQLTRATKINAVHVGADGAALVEVLVGRSEAPNEPFQVLVPRCVFLSPAESRRADAAACQRVRSFGAAQLAAARDQRWDRLRVVCTQPYNKHCKYGLNFVHVYSPEGSEAEAAAEATAGAKAVAEATTSKALPSRLLLDAADASSEDEFTPGELFAKHSQSQSDSGASDTGAKIRQATSQALKNISDSATKLVKTPIAKPPKRADAAGPARDRRRDLLYTDDDDRPHAKIDHIVQRHKDEKSKEEAKKPKTEKIDKKEKDSRNESFRRDIKKDELQSDRKEGRERKDKYDRTSEDERKNRPSSCKAPRSEASTSHRDDGDRKRSRDSQQAEKGPVELGSVLKGVVFALSGYVNPARAALRDRALSMGARCERDWSDRCTHLVCAFPNTPKLKQVRAGPGGRHVPAVTGAWLEQCHARRRLLPWRWFATEPQLRQDPPHDRSDEPPATPPPTRGDGNEDEDECDTDDEIEKALRKQKKRRTDRSPSPPARRDSEDEAATDDDAPKAKPEVIDAGAALPDIFEGSTFVIDRSVEAAAFDPRRLARYVTAYGGLVVEPSRAAEAGASYTLGVRRAGGSSRSGAWLRPDWLWRCVALGRLQPLRDYLLA